MSVYVNKSKCTGCMACVNTCPQKAIKMREDRYGFKYPYINNKKCTKCNLCKKICPNIEKKELKFSQKIYGCKAKNQEIRERSTSGGTFTLIAEFILDKGGVVFGAVIDDNFTVIHKKIVEKEDLKYLSGAKYVQSDLKNTFSEIKENLINNIPVLFSGTPCQVAGLKVFLKKEYEKLVTVDLVCHGVPSPLLWKKYVKYLSKNGQLTNFYFRNKSTGWRKSTTYYIIDGKDYYEGMKENPYTSMYFTHLSIREACHKCIHTNFQREGDFTLGDFWGIENVKPEFNDNKGVSLVMVNSFKAEEIFDTIKTELEYFETNREKAKQPQLIFPTKKSKQRKEFMKDLSKEEFEYLKNKYLNRKQ